MLAEGIWSMDDEGNFTLAEPYARMLKECKQSATSAWANAIVEYLEPRSPYSAEELLEALLTRNRERDDGSKVITFEEFVLEALTGDL